MGACDGKRMAGARAGAGQRQWPAGQSGLHLRGSDTGSAGFSCLGQPSTFLPGAGPRLYMYTKNRAFFILGIGNAPFASSDATYRADHYGVLRSRVLQRVVAVLQVKV